MSGRFGSANELLLGRCSRLSGFRNAPGDVGKQFMVAGCVAALGRSREVRLIK